MQHLAVNDVIAPNFINRLVNDQNLWDHIRECENCQDMVSTYVIFLHYNKKGFPVLTDEEKNKIKVSVAFLIENPNLRNFGFMWRRIFQLFTLRSDILAAADGQNADQQLLESSQHDGQLFFQAKCEYDDPHYWQAHLAIPIHPSPETILRIRINDGKGERISCGTLHFCGMRLTINDGIALLPLIEFQQHLNIPFVCIEDSMGTKQDGIPVLFPEEEKKR